MITLAALTTHVLETALHCTSSNAPSFYVHGALFRALLCCLLDPE